MIAAGVLTQVSGAGRTCDSCVLSSHPCLCFSDLDYLAGGKWEAKQEGKAQAQLSLCKLALYVKDMYYNSSLLWHCNKMCCLAVALYKALPRVTIDLHLAFHLLTPSDSGYSCMPQYGQE